MTDRVERHLNLIQRIIRHLRPESNELQDAIEEDIHFDREQVDVKLSELLHSARRMKRTSDAFIVAAELLVKDVRGDTRSKVSGQRTPQRSKASR